MSEWRALGLNDRLQEGDEWANKGQEDWTSVNYCHHGDKAGAWRLFDFRRRVSPAEQSSVVPNDKESLTVAVCPQCGHEDGWHNIECWKQRAEKAEALQSNCNSALKIAIEMLEETKAKLHQAEKERDQLRVEVEESRATAREECKIVCQLRAENERLRKHLELILPMAKGYAYQNPVGNNLQMVMDAQQALAAKGETK